MSVLARSFVFLPGIGAVRESRLWRRGIESWDDYRALARVPGIRPHIKRRHDDVLGVAAQALGRDAGFFARVLPSTEHWRAFRDFGAGAAYLDIETTGDRTNAVTVVGVRHQGQNRAFVRGQDYTPHAVSEFLSSATCLVTFNGASFDLPVLANDGVRLPAVPHVDLRVVFSRIGHTGGLKKIEDALGMGREGELKGLSGWDAVKLWRRWETRGDEEALRTLVAYNIADFENLEPLAGYACETLERETLAQVTAQQRLDGKAPEAASPANP